MALSSTGASTSRSRRCALFFFLPPPPFPGGRATGAWSATGAWDFEISKVCAAGIKPELSRSSL
jgi:hypothetical protein